MQLYKKRNFSALINDTFGLFRQRGKNYFRGYFAINGGFLLILMVLVYLVAKVLFDGLFSSLGTTANDDVLADYFDSNVPFFIGTGIFGALLLLIITVLSYSYPVIYLTLSEDGRLPAVKEIISRMKAKAGKIVVFSLLWLITFLPILILGGLFSLVLFAIIVGIPFAIIIFAAISCWMCLSFFDYLNNEISYFTAMKNGFNMLFHNFWHHVGVSVIFYVIVYIAQTIISMIPYLIGIIWMLSSGRMQGSEEDFSFLTIMIVIMFMLSTALGYILGNFIFISQGMIYYSVIEENENRSLHSEIDLIGTDSE